MADRKAALTMGPFSAMIRVIGAINDDKETDLKTICKGTQDKPHAAVKVNQRYACPSEGCGQERSSWHGWPRGRENSDGTFTSPDGDELADANRLDQDMKDKIEIFFAPREQVESFAVPNGKTYNLGLDAASSADPYAIIRDVIESVEDTLVPVAVWAYKTAPTLMRIVRMGNLLAAQQIAWPGAIKERPLCPESSYDERYMKSAAMVPEILTVDFNPETFVDVRKQKLAELLANSEAVAGGFVPDVGATPVDGGRDMVTELEAWVASKGKTVGGNGKAAPKKRAAKKTAANVKSLPAKKATAGRKSA